MKKKKQIDRQLLQQTVDIVEKNGPRPSPSVLYQEVDKILKVGIGVISGRMRDYGTVCKTKPTRVRGSSKVLTIKDLKSTGPLPSKQEVKEEPEQEANPNLVTLDLRDFIAEGLTIENIGDILLNELDSDENNLKRMRALRKAGSRYGIMHMSRSKFVELWRQLSDTN